MHHRAHACFFFCSFLAAAMMLNGCSRTTMGLAKEPPERTTKQAMTLTTPPHIFERPLPNRNMGPTSPHATPSAKSLTPLPALNDEEQKQKAQTDHARTRDTGNQNVPAS